VIPLLLAASASAQITGTVQGTIADSSGASVPKAKLTLTHKETGESRAQSADEEGRFAFHQLNIGAYELRTEAAGFRQALTEVNVRSGEIATVLLNLEIGQVTESITVTDAVSPLDAANSQIQVSVEGSALRELPVARNPVLFALTAPGTVPVTANNPFLGVGSFNSNGGRGRGNNITIDNITATDIVSTGVSGDQISPLNFEQIKEVKIITNNFGAEYGRNASSQLQFITRSGANEFHGVAYEFLRNNVLNARDFFDRSGQAAVTRRNQFGYALGGPILRNQTHFFTTYEAVRLRGLGASRIARVPTPAMVAQITDPTSRKLWDQYKVPVSESGQTPQSAGNFTSSFQLSFRIDHQFSENDNITAR
jgi:hypothetical protein